MRRLLLTLLLMLSFPPCPGHAEVTDPFDPFDTQLPGVRNELRDDEHKTPDELIREAMRDTQDSRPLDARSKLLLALKKDPKAYRAHLHLASYYLANVGHFRLALQYVKRAEELFTEKNGEPPYRDIRAQFEHQNILYLLAQTRLNLDNYQGALEVLDRYTHHGYYDDWYPGTRAWILMKLGRLSEAIKVAQIGYSLLSNDSEKGQVLNMLGILLSMNHQRASAIEIFQRAVAQEMATDGQPATPYNNMGEVYREIFDEDQAESAFLKATSLKDGCQHVLPALNLALLYLDQLNLRSAKRSIDNFEACVAQFPLKNGEEHRALVHLARGRIDLYSGKLDSAIEHFEAALDRKQWFGKIGTSESDLRAAGLMSLGQAYASHANQVRLLPSHDLLDWLNHQSLIMEYDVRAWWSLRRARQILIDELSNFEDLYVRSTDSLLTYSTLGMLTADIPPGRLEERITLLRQSDDRTRAHLFYTAYLAENALSHGEIGKGSMLTQQVIAGARQKFDDALKLHAILLKLRLYDYTSIDYRQLSQVAFALNRAAIRNYGLKLPVNFVSTDSEILTKFDRTPFFLDNSQKLPYSIKGEKQEGAYLLQFFSETGVIGNIRVRSTDLTQAVRKLIEEVFVQNLKDETT